MISFWFETIRSENNCGKSNQKITTGFLWDPRFVLLECSQRPIPPGNGAQLQHVRLAQWNRRLFVQVNLITDIGSMFRVTLTVACNLNLVNYPLDRQACAIRILSCQSLMRQLTLFMPRCLCGESNERNVV
jgi:hypothetical protein